MMDKFLFTTLPSNDLGLITRSLPIAHELRKRGHRIAFCNPAKSPRILISEAGFENLLPPNPVYHIISGEISTETLSRLFFSPELKQYARILISFARRMFKVSTAEIWNIDHFMYLFGMWNKSFVQTNVNALVELIQKYEPDCIVDFWNPFACIAARVCKIPLITVIQADMHPESQGFIWWRQAPVNLYPSPIPATNTILEDYALPSISQMSDLLVGDLTLVLGLPETDPLPKTADVNYIGSILWQKQDETLPDWVMNLSSDNPVIWVYPGNLQYMRGSRTAYDSAVVLQACLQALENESVQVILTTGYHTLPRRFTPLPANFHHEPYLPGLALAEQCDLLIHHGGYGSCQTGFYTGRPALVIPTYSERESNARRIAAAGAGDYVLPSSDLSGRKKQVSAEEVRAKVFNILSNPSFRENASKISERMKCYGGAVKAAQLIENFI